ncbi:MAG: RHS repeat protein [Gammaproteobacteria bacterium]|nr:RHS repeat protein [Gammaproteobacteria bacterium]NVK87689.1 RHS repeat protein [Gammaproteobacteria bacterium]
MLMLRKFLFVVLLLGIVLNSAAKVNLKNGNFYISYTDISFSDNFEFTRTYNSKSVFNGMFGFGWGNDYDAYLIVNGDGSITVRENGGGSSSHYRPVTPISVDLNSMVTQLVDAYQRLGVFASEAQAEAFRAKLISDRAVRNARWRKVVDDGLLAPVTLPPGTKLISESVANHSIQVTPFGYLRIRGNETERYDRQGRLSRVSESDATYTNIERNKLGHIRKVENHLGQYVNFYTDKEGRVIRMVSSDGKTSNFTYQGDDLIESFESNSNSRYVYRYDNNHNMTEIHYADGSKRLMTYTEKTQFLASETKPNGDKTEYEYVSADLANVEQIELDHGRVVERYGTYVMRTGFNGKQVRNSYFYEIAADKNGRNWTSRIETQVNGIKTTTDYHPCGLPLKIQRGRRLTEFAYNEACKLVYKNDGNRITRIIYEVKFGKIEQVETSDVDGNLISDAKFRYDNKGNLTFAENHKGTAVTLIYDAKGKISEMTDEKGRVMLFSYNAMGKPTKIILQGTGSIEVEYDSRGEITRVNSPEGHRMALQVTQMFQTLLSLVKPAGVNLNM